LAGQANTTLASANTTLQQAKDTLSTATTAATTATTQATASSVSASAALTSQNAAKASQDAAKASQDAAAASQVASKGSQDAAKASEQASAASQVAAKGSQDAAKVSETNSAGSAAAALASQNAARTSELNAASSASAASTSATSATASQADALASKNAAAASAAAAATSASIIDPNTYVQKVGGDVSGEIISTYPNQGRIIAGNYGVFWRGDNANYYLLKTASGDSRGTWDSKRPFTVSLADSSVTLAGDGANVYTGGTLRVSLGNPSTIGQVMLSAGNNAYNPVLRANSGNSTVEIVNNANTAVNLTVADNGIVTSRGDLYAGGNVHSVGGYSIIGSEGAGLASCRIRYDGVIQLSTSGGAYGAAYALWHQGNLPNPAQTTGATFTGQLAVNGTRLLFQASNGYSASMAADGPGNFIGFVNYAQNQYNAMVYDNGIVSFPRARPNWAGGLTPFDTGNLVPDVLKQWGFVGGDSNSPYMMRSTDNTLVRLVNQRIGQNNVNQPTRQNGYIEWITDIGSVGCNYFTSDEFFKENIVPNTKTYAQQVAAIKFVSFDFKPNDLDTNAGRHWDLGVIAQQVESDVSDEYIDYLSDGTLSLNTNKLLLLALKTIQELQGRVDVLEAAKAPT
jgi:hypothetical protein